jgi:hypothetical protein
MEKISSKMFIEFENIKTINIDASDSSSWENKVFLTFDLDWCSDEVLSFTLDIITQYDIKVTFFVTHKSSLLEMMKNDPNFELGIHPNFNFLLQGDFRYGKNIDEVIKYFKNIVPEAVSVRSHSMTQNSYILESFEKFGLIYDCNTFIPFSSNIILRPYKYFTGKIVKVPYFWEDDVHVLYRWDWDVKKFLRTPGLKVFDFHPIHVFLNTEDIKRYNSAKPYFKDYKKLKDFINTESYGVRKFLIDLIEEVKNENCNNR